MRFSKKLIKNIQVIPNKLEKTIFRRDENWMYNFRERTENK